MPRRRLRGGRCARSPRGGRRQSCAACTGCRMLEPKPKPVTAVARVVPAATTPPADTPDVSRQSLRGSSLLLVGRLLSIGLNLLAQILVVRALSVRDYGAFAYALTTVAFLDRKSVV